MRLLDRKARRDLWHLRGPVLAIALVVACGIASWVALRSMYHHLRAAQATYYRAYRFGDAFVQVRRAPTEAARALAALPGVAAVEVRAVGQVVLDVPGLAEPATVRLVGLPTDRALTLNRLAVRRGRLLAPGATDEAIVSEGFAEANGLVVGDSVGAVLGGRWRSLRVVGIALTPEAVYEIRPGDLFPDNRRYGTLWAEAATVESAFGLTGAWNDASLALAPGASEPAVLAAVDRLLARYGTAGAYGRGRHVSHRFLSDEIEENRTYSRLLPAVFLAVAAFLLHLVLGRLVASQREQLGMLKAYGASDATLIRHIAWLAAVPALLGTALGAGFGVWAAYRFADIYAEFFRFPGIAFAPRAGVVATAVLVTLPAAAVGGLAALRRVARLAPAEAMRPEPPTRFAHARLERWLTAPFGAVGRMTMRGLLRRPLRAGAAMLGMALGVSLVVVGTFTYEAIGWMRRVQFELAMRDDIAVQFETPQGEAVLAEMRRLPGVLAAEPVRAVAARLLHDGRVRDAAVMVPAPEPALRRAVDRQGRVLPAPASGALVSRWIADALALRPGDTLRAALLVGRRDTVALRVAETVDDLIGAGVWVTEAEYRARLGGDLVTGVALRVDPAASGALYARLKRLPDVQSVAVRGATLENFDGLVERSFAVTLLMLGVFAGALMLGVVYNTVRLALAERGRELASLRVLGFTHPEVARILLGEQAVLAAAALPAGIGLGALMAWGLVQAASREAFRLPFVLGWPTVSRATMLLIGTFLAAAVLAWVRLGRLDLVAVLKTRE